MNLINEVQISIDGSALNNGTSAATAGYGIVVELNDHVAEIKSALCPSCDYNLYTSNRAELRAAQTAINFLHEIAKSGHHKHCQVLGRNRSRRGDAPLNFVSDGRPIDATNFSAVIRTDSTFVLKGATGVSRQVRHKDLWTPIRNAVRCLKKAGVDLRFEHVTAHTGDSGNERADEMAKEMAARLVTEACDEGYPKEYWCMSCHIETSSLADLAVHFKTDHLGRNVKEESFLDALERGSESGLYECTMCERKLKSGFALRQHLIDKHAYE